MSDLFETLETFTPKENTPENIILEIITKFPHYNQLKALEAGKIIETIATNRIYHRATEIFTFSAHKSIAVKRKAATALGILGTKEIVPLINSWINSESDRETALVLQTTIIKISGINSRGGGVENKGEDSQNSKILTVGEALSMVTRLISTQEYIIESEIVELKYVHQMVYFTIKDDKENRLDCAIVVFKLNKINFPLNEGLKLIITGNFKFNKFSKLIFDVSGIELSGEGELIRSLKLLQKKLELEGLFDQERKQKMKRFPERVLLLASPISAAVDDFRKVLHARRPDIKIYFLPIKTMGTSAELEIATKLNTVNYFCKKHRIDTVILTRGGGSKEDLMVFNSQKICRALDSINVPVIVAIGHERDITLAELVGDYRGSTPSNAAEMCSETKNEILNSIRQNTGIIHSASKSRIQMASFIKSSLINKIILDTKNEINQIKNTTQKARSVVLKTIYNIKTFANWASNSIQKTTMNNLVVQKHEISIINLKINSIDPRNILNLGYSYITQNSKLVGKKSDLNKNLPLEINFIDGIKKI